MKLCQSRTIERFVARRFGLGGKSDVEQACVDMIVDSVEDTLKPLMVIYGEKDETKKAELRKKYIEETLPTNLGYLEKIAEKNGTGFFVGNQITVADIAFLVGFDWLKMFKLDYDLAKNKPKLNALKTKVASNPKIAAWVSKRPETSF